MNIPMHVHYEPKPGSESGQLTITNRESGEVYVDCTILGVTDSRELEIMIRNTLEVLERKLNS